MEETRKRRWLIVLFFSVIASLFIGFIYAAINGPMDPRYRRRLENAVTRFKQQQRQKPPDTVNITLDLNQEIQIGKNKIAFVGLENNILHLELFIMELDPEAGYPQAIPLKTARQGVQLGDYRYILKSAGKTRIRLQRIAE